MKLLLICICFSFFLYGASNAENTKKNNDSLIFTQDPDLCYEKLLEALNPKEQPGQTESKKVMRMDLANKNFPANVEQFKKIWFNPPVCQGITGSCWCFSSTSLLECEIKRLYDKEVKLSVMYTVYWEFVEKAKRFVREKGNSTFGRGSEPNASIMIWKKYGIVPEEFYKGIPDGKDFFDHSKMYPEMKNYLDSIKQNNLWDENATVDKIKEILDKYLGKPPDKITINNKEITPIQYLDDELKINLNDYMDLISLNNKPFYQHVEYDVFDNWWHSKDYLNLPIDDYMKIVKTAVRKGYGICIIGDTSEPGYVFSKGVAMVPDFDIPSEYINDDSRQFRHSLELTTDDHAILIVGYLEDKKDKDGKDWFLIKDSSTNAQNSKHPGYFFYHEDYIKLKMINAFVHKDIVNEVLKTKR